MEKYRCIVCGYIYDPAENDGVAFKDLPEDWVCPACGVGTDQFEVVTDWGRINSVHGIRLRRSIYVLSGSRLR